MKYLTLKKAEHTLLQPGVKHDFVFKGMENSLNS